MLLTWATNRLQFAQRGRGTGLWTGFLFVGEFASPLLVAGFKAAAGGLQPALGVLGAVPRCWPSWRSWWSPARPRR